MKEHEIYHLLERSAAGETLSEEEKNTLQTWQSSLFEKIEDNLNAYDQMEQPQIVPIKRWYRYAAAIAVLTLAVGGYFLVGNNKKESGKLASTHIQTDIKPGTVKAVLTLDDGSQIILDTTHNGTLAQQGNTKILNKNGVLAYKGSNNTAALYNTLTTHRGEQYPLTLSDGTKVWLNSASSIRFPVAFSGKERKVEITGEVYFEVTQNSRMPFIVTSNNISTLVLGTHFNINAYDDEANVKVTLLEGSIKVKKGHMAALVRPGQQAQVASNNQITLHNDIDLASVMAWKNGLFNFNNADLQTVLRQLSRWYNVNVVYEGNIPKREFEGQIQRNLSLSQVLKILEGNKVNLRIEGNNIIVKP